VATTFTRPQHMWLLPIEIFKVKNLLPKTKKYRWFKGQHRKRNTATVHMHQAFCTYRCNLQFLISKVCVCVNSYENCILQLQFYVNIVKKSAPVGAKCNFHKRNCRLHLRYEKLQIAPVNARCICNAARNTINQAWGLNFNFSNLEKRLKILLMSMEATLRIN